MSTVARRHGFASRGMTFAGIALAVGTVIFAFHLIQKERGSAIAFWTESARVQSIALAGYMRQVLLASDLVLRSVSDHVQTEGASNVAELQKLLGTREVHEMLRNRQGSVPQVSVASIVDRNGDMINFTRNYPPRANSGAAINLSERDYFKAHLQDASLQLFLSVPVENKGTGTWTFYLARKIRAPDSRTMLGVVLAGVECQHIQEFFSQPGGDGRQFVLVHESGALLARWPRDLGQLGASGRPPNGQLFNGSGPQLDPESMIQMIAELIGSLVGHVAPNAESTISVSTHVDGYPAFVYVGVPGPMVTATWTGPALKTLSMALLVVAATTVLTSLLLHLLRRNLRMVEALDEARQAAESATDAKAIFVATMSHEIRTPMNAIVGLVEALGRTQLDAKQQSLVNVVADSSDTLLQLVNEVLDFSRIEASEKTLKEVTFSVSKLVEQVIGAAKAYPYGRQLKLEQIVDGDIPTFLHGDKGRISRILLNLLSNALKYTDRGTVTLALRMHDVQGDRAVIDFSVIDTGVGVAQDMHNRIFDPYEQAHPERASTTRGSGLGLSISRRVAEALGGTLTLAASGPEGSTFTLRIPLRIGSAAPIVDPAGTIGNSLTKGLDVLVAEDTASSQLVLKLVLETLGAHVLVVDNGAEAVEAVLKGAFDIVFLDVQMPIMTGLEAAHSIRHHFASCGGQPPLIIGVSAYAEETDRRRALESGMDDYLTKPIRSMDVSDLLMKRVLPKARHAPAQSADAVMATTALDSVEERFLADLLSALGSENFSDALLQFRRDADEANRKTLTFIATRNVDGVRVMAHRLKGLFNQFGAHAAAAEAERVQKAPAEAVLTAAAALAATTPQTVAAVNSTALALLATAA